MTNKEILEGVEWFNESEVLAAMDAAREDEAGKWENEAKEAWRKIEIYKDSADRYKSAYEEQCEEMENEATKFHDWVESKGWEIDFGEQYTHSTTELYRIYNNYKKQ